jgi:hypothetical protein
VAEGELSQRERRWFVDARGIDRRLGISSHTELGLIVLSLWSGETCTATFQLPVTEAPRLIGTLADGLAEGLPAPDAAPRAVTPPRWRTRLARLRRAGRGRSRRTPAVPDATGPRLTLVRGADHAD